MNREIGSALGLKMKCLGAQAGDLEILLQAIKRCVSGVARGSVFHEVDTAAKVRVLLSGTTCSYKRKEDGTRLILSFQHPGDFCHLHPGVPEREAAIGIQALTECTIAIIDHRDMDKLLSRPALASALWRASLLEAAIYRQRMSSMSRGTALERVAHLLCEQLARREAVGIHDPHLPFSQIDIADAAGLSVVHVNRTIQTLQSLNVLSNTSHAIEVVDREQLATIAEFDSRYLSTAELASKWAVQIEKIAH